MFLKDVPLVPKNSDGILRVLMVSRISKQCPNVESEQALHDELVKFLATLYTGQTLIKHIYEMACGASADVATRVEEEVASDEFDLVLIDSLSRISRRHHRLYALTNVCIDHGTRLISAHDGLDTADRNVMVSVSLIALKSELAISDHRRSRARRSAKSRRNAKQ